MWMKYSIVFFSKLLSYKYWTYFNHSFFYISVDNVPKPTYLYFLTVIKSN
jgi:hypothetical protein